MLITEAVIFAAQKHDTQKRKGTDIPYILHPLETGLIASQITSDENVICAAILHDVVEDSKVTPGDIAKMFGERVSALVMTQSEDKSKSWHDRKRNTIDYLERTQDSDAKIITLADKLSNIRSLSSDYKKLGDALWERFNEKDKDKQGWYYKSIAAALKEFQGNPFYEEYVRLVREIFGGEADGRAAAILERALKNLTKNFMTVEEFAKAGASGELAVMENPLGYDYSFAQKYPSHPMSGSRFTRIQGADDIRDLARDYGYLFTGDVLDKIHVFLFDCCAAVRHALAIALFYAGNDSSVPFLRRLLEQEKESDMVKKEAKNALEKLSRPVNTD